VVGLAYLLFAPVPITPAAWTPPAAPALTGQYEQNTRLSPVQKLSLGDGHKPEDVALDADGKSTPVLKTAGSWSCNRTARSRVFCKHQGRPLGLIFDRSGNLIVADAIKGLLSVK
jgi:sugar lactone lactonase YvrE